MPLPQFMASSTAGEYFHGTLLKFTDQTVAPSKFLHKKYWKEFFFVLQGNGQLVWYANQTKYEQKKAFVGAMDLMALKDTSTHCYGHIDEKKNKTNKGGWFGGGKNKELTGNYYFVEIRNGPAMFLLASDNIMTRDSWNGALTTAIDDVKRNNMRFAPKGPAPKGPAPKGPAPKGPAPKGPAKGPRGPVPPPGGPRGKPIAPPKKKGFVQPPGSRGPVPPPGRPRGNL
jgi:hypothetical protein